MLRLYLVIAEKPDLGKAIAAAIPGDNDFNKREQLIKTTYKGQPMTIIWCFGHLLTLVEPKEYDAKYATWDMANLPFFFENWRLCPKPSTDGRPGTEARIKQIASYLKKADTVIHAGDVDDEGQLLVDEVLRYCNYTGNVLRLNTSDTSETAIAKELERMDDNRNHEAAGWAAYGRELSDKTFGYNLSQYYSLLNHRLLRVGRVKMPTLGLVVQRDEQIENHKKVIYYNATAYMNINGTEIQCKFVPNKEDTHHVDGKILNKDYMQEIINNLQGMNLSDILITSCEKKESPPLPFNLTKLYAYCSNRWGLQPSNVLAITQSLREHWHAITYNRTSCQFLSTEQYKEAPNTIQFVMRNMGFDQGDTLVQPDPSIKSRCFDDEAVATAAHTAMIPTASSQDISAFSEDERHVYEAISLFYLVQFLPPTIKQVTSLSAPAVNGGCLKASSSVIKDLGYRYLLNSEDLTRTEEDAIVDKEETSVLSSLLPGRYCGSIIKAELKEAETKPLPRYTATTLITDMTSISKYVTNDAVKKLLLKKDEGKKDEHGSIGTPATRDKIVKELVQTGYLCEKRVGKKIQLISTEMGREFYHMLPDSIRKVDVSAKWWWEQEQIRNGKMTPNQMARDVLKTVSVIVQSGEGIMENAEKYADDVEGVPLGKCPICDGDVIESGSVFRCKDKSCQFVVWKKNKLFESMGKTLKASNVKDILTKGRCHLTNCKSTKKPGITYDCYIKFEIDKENNRVNLVFDNPQRENVIVGSCPKCHSDMVATEKAATCSNSECKFAIWKDNTAIQKVLPKKILTNDEIKHLLEVGSVRVEDNIKGNGWVEISMVVELDQKYPDFSFKSSNDKVIGKCPKCNGKMLFNGHAAFCTNSKCGFSLSTNNPFVKSRGTILSERNIIDLLTKKSCHLIKCKSLKYKNYVYECDLFLTGINEKNYPQFEVKNIKKK